MLATHILTTKCCISRSAWTCQGDLHFSRLSSRSLHYAIDMQVPSVLAAQARNVAQSDDSLSPGTTNAIGPCRYFVYGWNWVKFKQQGALSMIYDPVNRTPAGIDITHLGSEPAARLHFRRLPPWVLRPDRLGHCFGARDLTNSKTSSACPGTLTLLRHSLTSLPSLSMTKVDRSIPRTFLPYMFFILTTSNF